MIYLVDDAADYRFLVQHVFKRFLPQYPLRLFADGMEFIRFIEADSNSLQADLTGATPIIPNQGRPGLIVLDVDMPKLSGFQTLEQLKQYTLWQSIPVVMMSNRLEASFQTEAFALGASSYITKPLDIVSLKEVMSQLCHQWLDG